MRFDQVVGLLLQKLERRREDLGKSGAPLKGRPLLFLIGAGCSIQYGLPGYRDLLYLLLTEKLRKRYEIRRDALLGELQREIEVPWRQSWDYHQDWLSEYLTGVDGRHCLGYRRLARLLKEGLIDGVINLNLDRLFTEACRAEDFDPIPTKEVHEQAGPFLVEPHGGIGDRAQAPILDLRGDRTVAFDLKRMLARSHVVVVGYGGGDDSILRALAPEEAPEGGWGNLFYFNLEEPQESSVWNRLLSAQVERNKGDDLAVFEPSSTFENLMEILEEGLNPRPRAPKPARTGSERIDAPFERFTHSEALALTRCRRLADRLRLAASVSDSSPIEIAEHAREIAELALRLAEAAGLHLLPLERVLLYAVALFHDLGYYWSASHERFGRYKGWRIHRLHGAMVSRMLRGWWQENDELLEDYIPAAYGLSTVDQHRFVETVFWLCTHHNSLLAVDRDAPESLELVVAGVPMPVRRRLLQVLISASEHLRLEHPFEPSLDPVDHDRSELGAIDDPVLHLILVRRRGVRFEVEVTGGKVSGIVDPKWSGKLITKFFVARIEFLMDALSKLAEPGRKVEFESGIAIEPEWRAKMLGTRGIATCLEESLAEAVGAVEAADRIDTHVALLDLVAIYSLQVRGDWREEPRLDDARSPAVHRAMERVKDAGLQEQRKSLVEEYVHGRMEGGEDAIGAEFSRCFETRIFPAWRFVGKKWRDGIEAPTTALTTLEMGSSRYRSEVVVGLRKLLREKVEWKGNLAKAHDGCILCSSRLVMAFSYARLLFEAKELEERFVDFQGFNLLDALRGLMRYLLGLPADDPCWRGEQPHKGKIPVRSADYLAFAAGAVGFFLTIEELVQARGREALDLEQAPRRPLRVSGRRAQLAKSVETLLRERWAAVYGLTREALLSPEAEEPHSLVLGRVALILLSRDYFTPKVEQAIAASGRPEVFTEELFKAWQSLEGHPLSHLGRLNLWPALLLLDRLRPSTELVHANLARYRECRDSPIWVDRGAELGSWGFNVLTTSMVCSSLNAFWRHVLFFSGNRERYRALWSELQLSSAD
jgi:hypothetical protein